MNNTNKPWKRRKAIKGIKSKEFSSKDVTPPGISNQNFDQDSYINDDLTKILFLSKRGMSRSPLAREMMRSLLEGTQLFGRVRCASRGVTEAYDQCPIDARMSKFSSRIGYFLQGFSRFVTIPDLASADIVITLDHESEEFVRVHSTYIRGISQPIGIYFTQGSFPYVQDPYERGDDEDVDDHYDEIVTSIEYGCSKFFAQLPSLISY
jgi:protein-tyrosine-phosphatase